VDYFFSLWRDYWKVLGCFLVFASAPFVVEYVAHAGPPWLAPGMVSILSGTVMCLVLVSRVAASERHDAERLSSLTTTTTILAVGAIVFYAFCYAFFVFPAPDWKYRDARGLILKDGAKAALAADPSLSIDKLLEGAGFQPERIYVDWTVYLNRFALLATWLLFLGALSNTVMSFVLHQRRPREASQTTTRG
jgi:hypothetical protein